MKSPGQVDLRRGEEVQVVASTEALARGMMIKIIKHMQAALQGQYHLPVSSVTFLKCIQEDTLRSLGERIPVC